MSELISLATLPDELSQGYSGRLARANGFDSNKALEHYLSLRLRCSQSMFDLPVSKVERLATMAGMSLHAYVQSHSMLALWQGVRSAPTSRIVERDFYQGLLTYGVRASRSALHYCPQCAKEDVLFHGMSYWRREHQIPGVHGCVKHAQPLSYTAWSNAFQAPSLLGIRQQVNSRLFDISLNCSPVLRARELAHGLLQWGRSRPIEYIYAALHPCLVAVGIDQYGYVHAKSRLYELIQNSFPQEWLRASFADEQFSYREQLFLSDGNDLLPLERPSTFWMLVLAMAATTKSADEALNLWTGYQPSSGSLLAGNASVHEVDAHLINSARAFYSDRVSEAQRSIADVHGNQLLELLRALTGQWLQESTGPDKSSWEPIMTKLGLLGSP